MKSISAVGIWTRIGYCSVIVAFFFAGALCADEGLAQSGRSAQEFREACAQKAAAPEDLVITGNDGWLFLRSELRHLGVGAFWGEAAAGVSRAQRPDRADPLPAILDFHQQLQAMGIQLILAPVPCKAVVYPEQIIGPVTEQVDTFHQQFYALLRENGVDVLDLTDVFLAEKERADAPALYCRTDTHWSPRACEMAAEQIKTAIGTADWLPAKPGTFDMQREDRTIIGDLTDGKGSEVLTVRVVESNDDRLLRDKSSPILLLGDSHTLVFHAGGDLHGSGAGLADQIAAELGTAVDVIGVRGSGATSARINLIRRARADAAYLAGKRVVIWCFAAREFTESTGWRSLKLLSTQ